MHSDRLIYAAHDWKTNAALIRDVASLHLRDDWLWLDMTYGRGLWWSDWCPEGLVFNDLYTQQGFDFRDLPFDDCLFDAVAYDPPYIVMGQQTAANKGNYTSPERRFGVRPGEFTPVGLQTDLINPGLEEAHRIVKCGGLVIVKCQDYIKSGIYWPGSHHTLTKALTLGFSLVDRFEMLAGVRPQPGGRVQRHARRNVSTLFVFKKVRTNELGIIPQLSLSAPIEDLSDALFTDP